MWRAPEDARRVCEGGIVSTSREKKTESGLTNWAAAALVSKIYVLTI